MVRVEVGGAGGGGATHEATHPFFPGGGSGEERTVRGNLGTDGGAGGEDAANNRGEGVAGALVMD